MQAIKDAQKGSKEARQWMFEDWDGFAFWCEVYGIPPKHARRHLDKALKSVCITREQRRLMILEALKQEPHLSNREIGRRLGVGYEAVRQVRMKL